MYLKYEMKYSMSKFPFVCLYFHKRFSIHMIGFDFQLAFHIKTQEI